uniref:Uncharacterized protein n=1 Tax=Magallana gigas TaxID=29159 RepID=K1R354_MAGGI
MVWSVLIAVEGVKTTNLATIFNGTCLRGCEYRVTGVRTNANLGISELTVAGNVASVYVVVNVIMPTESAQKGVLMDFKAQSFITAEASLKFQALRDKMNREIEPHTLP